MVLQDHFRPPLGARRHWHAFHNAWATYISSDLNRRLPEGYFAEPNVQFGIEIDVAAFEEADFPMNRPSTAGIDPDGWVVSAPTQTIPLPVITDVVEVLVFDRDGGPTLAGAIELVSPANKDRPDHREAFVTKCAAYLQQGLGLRHRRRRDRARSTATALMKRLARLRPCRSTRTCTPRRIGRSTATVSLPSTSGRGPGDRQVAPQPAALAARLPLSACRPGRDLRAYLPRATDPGQRVDDSSAHQRSFIRQKRTDRPWPRGASREDRRSAAVLRCLVAPNSSRNAAAAESRPNRSGRGRGSASAIYPSSER